MTTLFPATEQCAERPAMSVLFLRDPEADLGDAIAAGFAGTGCALTDRPRWKLPITADELCAHDLVVSFGPHHGGMVAVTQALLACPPQRRPRFCWWLTENSPNLDKPAWRLRLESQLRWWADCCFGHPVSNTKNWRLPLLQRVARRARILGELYHARRSGVLDLVAVTAEQRELWLRQRGFNTVHAPLGYHESFGQDLSQPRDIDVVYLGQAPKDRRRHLLTALVDTLGKEGVRVEMQQGQNGYLQGEARTQYLNRAKILLNVMNYPSDWTGHRLLVGMANKALIVSEPMVHRTPFIAGQHLVEAEPARMAEAILHYLRHEDERRTITDAAYDLLTGQLTMPQMCARILEAARSARHRDARAVPTPPSVLTPAA